MATQYVMENTISKDAVTLTAAESARYLGVHYATLLRLIKRGHIRTIPGLRHKRITPGELRRYLNSGS